MIAFRGLGSSGVARFAGAVMALLAALAAGLPVSPALALTIELDDVAPDRIERQRAFARGILPGGTAPDSDTLEDRLAAQGLIEGAPILIRIFKAESELELWMRKGDAFVLKGTYPICHWTGTLGPKLREGDKQSPEGFYTIGAPQMRHRGRWQRAFNLGFPNLHDKTLQRTGSYILVHGGCSSTGCYAMTEPTQREIHRLATAALGRGQARFQVHVFPFRMTEANLAQHVESPWAEFWRDLKAGYDAFEQTRLPPHLNLCGQRYVVMPAARGERTDAPLTRIDARTVAATGLDPAICRVAPVAQLSAEQVAAVSDRAPGDRATEAESSDATAPRAVFRVERRAVAAEPMVEEPAPPGWRPVASRRASPPPSSRRMPKESVAGKRARLAEKRRAHRAALDEISRRNGATIAGRHNSP